MLIREARPEEYGVAGDVAVAAYGGFYGEDLGDYEERLRDVAARARDAVVLVAVEGSDIVGTVTYVPDPASRYSEGQRDGEAAVRMLAVVPGTQRRGVGRALSIACIDRARADGKRAVVLHADEAMSASRSLYESLGFRRDETRDFRPDEVTFLVCYVLKL